MRLISYHTQDGWAGGVVVASDGDRPVGVVDIATAASAADVEPTPRSVRDVLELPAPVRAIVAEQAVALARSRPELVLAGEELVIGPPIPDPDKIICLGLNYSDHAAEAGLPVPPAPMLFAKYRNALIGPSEPLYLPAEELSDEVDYEGELAVVIGTVAQDVDEASALSHVAGYTVLNDISARDLQSETGQWLAGKSLDGFAPCGPVLVSADEIADPHDLHLETRVNGEVVQAASTGLMIYTIAQSISFISRVMTLVPGDIIATGTPAGVGSRRTPPVFLRPGDTVAVAIDGIGAVSTPVLAAADKPALVA